MLASVEPPRTRWLVLAAIWIGIAALLTVHAQFVGTYFQPVEKLGLRGQPAAATPLKAAYPTFASDAQMWVRNALALAEGDTLRLRHTTADNAPEGREVHWNSAGPGPSGARARSIAPSRASRCRKRSSTRHAGCQRRA